MTSNPTRLEPARLAAVATGLVLVLLGSAATLTFGLIFGGGAAPLEVLDAGPIVRWGLPASKLLFNISMALSIGSLVLAGFASADGSRLLRRLQTVAVWASVAWVVTGLANLIFTYLDVTATPFSASERFGSGLWLFATTIELGQYLSVNLVLALLVSTLALLVSRVTSTGLLAAVALAGIVPLALTGHAAGTSGHAMAVNALGLHLVGVTVWVGGLLALLLSGAEGSERSTLLRRYSSLALAAFAVVAISGVASSLVRLRKPEDFASVYALLVYGKAALLVLLGGFGAWYRLRVVSRQSGRAAFAGLTAVELGIMGAAIGLATALARTAPPVNDVDLSNLTPAQILTGEPLPEPLGAIQWLTVWKPDLLWLVLIAAATGAYLLGVWRLSRRGDKWPPSRTVSWVAGMLMLLYITSGPPNAYQEYLFSVHMIAHMMLTMGVPVLLVPGAPVTLLMRAVEKRQDNTWGVREWVLWAVHTPYARFISHPLVAGAMFASSLVVFYFTDLFSWSTREHIGHEWMIVHFLITGYLFVQALVGVDPGPSKLAYPMRLLLLIGTLAFHAFFGLALMTGEGLLLADWYGAMGRTWGDSPLIDQQTGGAIAWGIGEIPTAALTLIVSIQWARADKRESTRLDRASDRTGNRDVDDYNAMLAKLAERDNQANRDRQQ